MERKQEFLHTVSNCRVYEYASAAVRHPGTVNVFRLPGSRTCERMRTQGGENRKPQVQPSEKHGTVDVNGYHICTHALQYHKHAHSVASLFSASVRLYSSSSSHTSIQRTRVGRPRSMYFPPHICRRFPLACSRRDTHGAHLQI